MRRELYRATNLPVLQNRTFAGADSAKHSASADIVLVQDEASGLIFNDAFDADKLSYDSDYQHEQAHSSQCSTIGRLLKRRDLFPVPAAGRRYGRHQPAVIYR